MYVYTHTHIRTYISKDKDWVLYLFKNIMKYKKKEFIRGIKILKWIMWFKVNDKD